MDRLGGWCQALVLLLSRRDVESILSMEDAIQAVEGAFKQFALGKVTMPMRTNVTLESYRGQFLTMPGYVGGEVEGLGLKVVTVYPENPSRGLPTILATIQLNNPRTGELLAIMDGAYITAVRTGAVSGVATKHLSRKGSSVVGLFGAGVQAEKQLEAVCCVRPIAKVKVFDPLVNLREKFCSEASRKLGVDVVSVSSPMDAVVGCEMLITATTSKTPVFSGRWVEAGAHINAIGAHTSDARELDDDVARKAKIVVDSRETALREAGDLIIPIKAGIIGEENIHAELGEILVGSKLGRETDREITLFKSVGLALQDVSTATLVYRKAVERNVGVNMDF